jgi:geranylgeranyl diphosphate synthase type I
MIAHMNSNPSTSFSEFAKLAKNTIAGKISAIFRENKAIFARLPEMGDWLAAAMEDFAISGKMLRGALALIGAQLFRGRHEEENAHEILSLAAGLELLQAGLLVHDDIMDHDERRRGKPTVHFRIKNKLLEAAPGFEEALALDMAEAQGICVGDLFFFIAWEEVTKLKAQISRLIAREHAIVSLAQMRDIALGYDTRFPSVEEVLDMYRYKTARYTVALPLHAGALMSKQVDHEVVQLLEVFGEALGIVFQLQDDRLGLFGDEQSIGKSVGSDLKEGKKTLYILALQNTMNQEESSRFSSIYKSSNIAAHDIDWLCKLIVAKGIDADIQKIIEEQLSQARAALAAISGLKGVRDDSIQLLESFIDYSGQRKY